MTTSGSHQTRRRHVGDDVSATSSTSSGSRRRSRRSRRYVVVAVSSPPTCVLRSSVVLLVLIASLVHPAAAAVHRRRPPGAYERRRDPSPQRYVHGRRLVADVDRLEPWQVAHCRKSEHYTACFLCGKIVQSREIYYGCCYMNEDVLLFCDELLE